MLLNLHLPYLHMAADVAIASPNYVMLTFHGDYKSDEFFY